MSGGKTAAVKPARGWFRHRWRLLAWLAVAVWLGLVLRFWHPVYGFTRFLQYDAAAESCAISELRAQPVFVYRDTGGYDGHYYAQIAFHPALRSSEFPSAIDNLRYRARRILGSALAWTLSLGDPTRVPHVYASLNLVAWLALAAVLWRLLPVSDARSWCAWAGVLFSAGALCSVRFALSDLLALLGVALAWWQLERTHRRGGLAWLATAALARETSLAAAVGWWDELRLHPRTWAKPARFTLLALAPLALWIAYTYWAAPVGDQAGIANLTWPLVGWLQKIQEMGQTGPGSLASWPILATALGFVGLTTQALWFALHPRPNDRVWRLGAVYTVLFCVLGFAVWEGNPGAATRVLLPLTFAFALAAVRSRISWGWLLVGMLPVVAGFDSLRVVSYDSREVAAARFHSGAVVVRTGGDFHPVERSSREVWAWSAGRGEFSLARWGDPTTSLLLELEVRTLSPGTTQIRSGDATIWQGATCPEWQRVQFAVPTSKESQLLHVETDAAPQTEGGGPHSRRLSLAVRRVQVSPNVTPR